MGLELIKFSFEGQKYVIPKHKAQNKVMQNFLKSTTILSDNYIPKFTHKKKRKIKRQPQRQVVIFAPKIRRTRRTVRRRKLTGVEMKNLRGLAPKFGLSSDAFDFHSEIDRSLSYQENKRILKKKIRRRTGVIPLEELRQDRYNFMKAQYLDDLQFKADAGDTEALRELRILAGRGYKK